MIQHQKYMNKPPFGFGELKLPQIRDYYPSLIMNEINNVQPISDDVYRVFKAVAMESERKRPFGSLIHEFLRGWRVAITDNKTIPLERFKSLYGADKIIGYQKHRLRSIL